jgi:hypothetical protein
VPKRGAECGVQHVPPYLGWLAKRLQLVTVWKRSMHSMHSGFRDAGQLESMGCCGGCICSRSQKQWMWRPNSDAGVGVRIGVRRPAYAKVASSDVARSRFISGFDGGADGRIRTDNLRFTKLQRLVSASLVVFHSPMIPGVFVPLRPVTSRSGPGLCCQNCCRSDVCLPVHCCRCISSR